MSNLSFRVRRPEPEPYRSPVVQALKTAALFAGELALIGMTFLAITAFVVFVWGAWCP